MSKSDVVDWGSADYDPWAEGDEDFTVTVIMTLPDGA